MENEKDLQVIDIDREAEKICRWAAARAGVIVAAPLAGTMALMANEVYMIIRLGNLRGVHLDEGAVLGLLSSLGATFAGQTLATLIPFAPLQVPLGISVTYAVGRAANAWLKAGRPEDVAVFREVYEEARREGAAQYEEIKNMGCRNRPLGDESRRFGLNAEKLFDTLAERADAAETAVSDAWRKMNAKIGASWQEYGGNWLSAQTCAQLRQGGLRLPYDAVRERIARELEGGRTAILELSYADAEKFCVVLKHADYGVVRLVLGVREFYVGASRAEAQFTLEECSVSGEGALGLLLRFVGAKFIAGLLGAFVNNFSSGDGTLRAQYSDSVLSVDFAAAIASFRTGGAVQQKLTELFELTALTPQPGGFLMQARLRR